MQAQAREPPGPQRAPQMQRALPRQVPLAAVQVAALARQRAAALRADQSYLNCYWIFLYNFNYESETNLSDE